MDKYHKPPDHDRMVAFIRDAMVTEVARSYRKSDGIDMMRLADVAAEAMIDWIMTHPVKVN